MAWRKCTDCGRMFDAPNKGRRLCPSCKGYAKPHLGGAKKTVKTKRNFPSIMAVTRVERIYNAVNGTHKHYHEIVNIIDNTAADRCVCCGEAIPEGRMVCPVCEQKGERVSVDDL